MSNSIDIVMTARNRLDYTRQSIEHIINRTRTPYNLHVINDQSTDGTTDYLIDLWRAGIICDLVLRNRRAGTMANRNLSTWLSFSDPFVITSDDILCPDVEPDWLSRGVTALLDRANVERPLGQLDLNHPGAYRIRYKDDGVVAYCRAVGGTFGFIRRTMVPYIALPHYENNFGSTEDVMRSNQIQAAGFSVGYLIETFCYHIGKVSIQSGSTYSGAFIEPLDWKSLRPAEEFVWM